MPYISKQEALEQIQMYDEDTKFCPQCLTALTDAEDNGEHYWYCANELCLYYEEYPE